MATILRPLSLSELLDRTFFLYRKYFLLFVGIVGVPYLVLMAAGILSAGFFFAKTYAIGAVIIGIGFILYLFALAASQAATVIAVADVHLEKPASIGGSFRALKGNFLRIVLVMIGEWIALAAACFPALLSMLLISKTLWALPLPFLLGIPVIGLGIAWSLVVPVTVLEGVWLIKSLSRSFSLTQGSIFRILLIYFLFACIAVAASMIVEVIFIVIFAIMAAMHASPTATIVSMVFSYLIGFLSSVLIGPLFGIAVTLIYFDQRVRKEGFDLQLMMATVQPAPQAVPAVMV